MQDLGLESAGLNRKIQNLELRIANHSTALGSVFASFLSCLSSLFHPVSCTRTLTLEGLWNIPRSVRGTVVKSTIILPNPPWNQVWDHMVRGVDFFGALHICSYIFLWPDHPDFLCLSGSCGREDRLARIFLFSSFRWILNCLLKSDLRENLQNFSLFSTWGAVTPLSPQPLRIVWWQAHFCLFFRYFGDCPGEAAVPEDRVRACRVPGHLCSPQQCSQSPGAPPEIPRQGEFGR